MSVQLSNGRGWLNADAAASIARMDKQQGSPITITSAGRTHAEQAALVARWNRGGAANRPPYLYKPAPAGQSPHESGEAIDTPEHAWMVAHGTENGWVHTIASDTPHWQYFAAKDKHSGEPSPFAGATGDGSGQIQTDVLTQVKAGLSWFGNSDNWVRIGLGALGTALLIFAAIKLFAQTDVGQAAINGAMDTAESAIKVAAVVPK